VTLHEGLPYDGRRTVQDVLTSPVKSASLRQCDIGRPPEGYINSAKRTVDPPRQQATVRSLETRYPTAGQRKSDDTATGQPSARLGKTLAASRANQGPGSERLRRWVSFLTICGAPRTGNDEAYSRGTILRAAWRWNLAFCSTRPATKDLDLVFGWRPQNSASIF